MTKPPPVTSPRACSAWWLSLAALGPLLLLALYASLGESERLSMLARLLYFAPPIALAAAVWTLVRAWLRSPARWRTARALWPGVLSATALLTAVLLASPPAMRMQFDESSLVAVSQSMHEQRAALMTTGAVPFDGELVRLENTVDKRPPLFPFLVSVAHDLTGARVGNAFAVNAIVLVIGLVLAFAAVRERLGLAAAFTAQMLLAAVPLTALVATSAAFDLLATVLFLAVLLAALRAVRTDDVVPLLALGGLFAQSRYESLPALALVFALVALRLRRRLVWTRTRLAFAVAQGWLAAPIVVQLVYAWDPKFYPEAAGRPRFDLGYVAEHLPPFLEQWFAPALANPLPGLLAILGVLAYALRLARRRATFTDVLIGLPVAAATATMLVWFYGDVREPTALRLFLPAAWLTALLPLALVPHLRRGAAWAVLAAAVLLLGLRLGPVARGEVVPRLRNAELVAAIERAVAAIDDEGAAASHTLWITTVAQHLVVCGRAALSPRSFAARAQEVQHYARGDHVREILVLTTPFDAAFAPAYGDPADVVQTTRAVLVRRFDGDQPLAVHRVPLR